MWKPWILLPLSVLVAIPARLLSTPGSSPASVAGAALLPTSLKAVGRAAADLGLQNEALRERIARLQSAPQVSFEEETSPEQVAEAVQAWLDAQRLNVSVLTEIALPEAEPLGRIAELPLADLLPLTLELLPFHPDSEAIYQEIRDGGRMDELIEGLEAMVEADPGNPDLRVSLGIAYLEKLFGLKGASMAAGRLAMGADQAFDRALELDPSNVKGRFSKAVALSNWPQIMGKTGQAIEQFKILVDQIERGELAEPLSEPYLFLGNMYLRSGDEQAALDIWKKGLERFPGNATLQAQIDAER